MKTQILVIHDKVLIQPKEMEKSGSIFIPQGVSTAKEVRGGIVVGKGEGYPMRNDNGDTKPWEQNKIAVAYVPLKVMLDDYVYFATEAARELQHEGKNYIVIPEAAIVLIVRPLMDANE